MTTATTSLRDALAMALQHIRICAPDPTVDAALDAALSALSTPPAGERDDTARLDFIERTFSGVTNRERYLPVQMIWGDGCNGRTLREACDKHMKRATPEPATQEVG